jgi:hypothetical protein
VDEHQTGEVSLGGISMIGLMKALLFLTAAIFLVSVPLSAGASGWSESVDSLRCGTHLAQVGETQLKVLYQCGEPSAKASYPYYGHSGVDGTVEKWTYNRGPDDFIYDFTFMDGRLEDIKRLGRGF